MTAVWGSQDLSNSPWFGSSKAYRSCRFHLRWLAAPGSLVWAASVCCWWRRAWRAWSAGPSRGGAWKGCGLNLVRPSGSRDLEKDDSFQGQLCQHRPHTVSACFLHELLEFQCWGYSVRQRRRRTKPAFWTSVTLIQYTQHAREICGTRDLVWRMLISQIWAWCRVLKVLTVLTFLTFNNWLEPAFPPATPKAPFQPPLATSPPPVPGR